MKKLIPILILMLLATAARAETYQWIDKEGTVHFTDSRASIPAKYRKSATPLGIDTQGTASGTTTQSVDASPTRSAPSQFVDAGSVDPQIEGMKTRMMNDEGVMSLIRGMQDDPDMQAILNDPAIVKAVQSGDVGALMNNPTFLKLLNNPKVKEIEKRMQGGGK